MSVRIEARNWQGSPLGPRSGWPQALGTLLDVMLASPQPMLIAWGAERTVLHNDGFATLLDAGHPDVLGADLSTLWPDLVPFLRCVERGETVRAKIVLGVLDLVPVRGAAGTVEGIFCPRVETDDAHMLRLERDRGLNIIASMTEGFVLIDHEYRVLQINAEGLRMEGRPASEIVGKSHWDAWPGSEDSELGRLYKTALRDYVPVTLDHHHVWPDGHGSWLEMRAFPTSEGLAIFYRDVSARKEAEAALRESRAAAEQSSAEQSAVLRQLVEGVIVTDADGRITIVNGAAADIHGVERLDVAPKEYSDTYHLFTEDGRPHDPLALPLARAVRGETVKDARWRIRRPDGREVLAIGSAQPLLGADGRQVGAVLTLRDDTAREAAERASRESEARLRALTDNLPSGAVFQLMARHDGTNHRFHYVSQSYERLTGVPVEAVLADARVAFDLILPVDREALHAAEIDAIETGTPIDIETRFRHAHTGEISWSRIIAAARELPGDAFVWDGLQIDTTDQKRAEAALLELNETLEQRVASRTRELAAANTEADAARRLAEAANEAKSEFLASMSHEIRTPLHGVLGLAELLLDSDLAADQRNSVERLKAAGTALRTIVDDILDFSKIEAGQIQLEANPFDLAGLIDNVIAIVQVSAQTKGLGLVVEPEPSLPSWLVGDESRIRQVLLNLLNNAIKFTPSGSVRLKVLRREAPEMACGLRFVVEDTGIGIPKDKAHRLFERFSQLDGSIRRQYGGTGLGLAISKKLVDLMGGQIGAISVERGGSTFYFDVTLPVSGAPGAASPRDASDTVTARGASILVVDDVTLNLDIVRALLEKAGHVVETVTDGAAAVKAVQEKPYDLVLMDVQMPGMDGISATRTIRALGGPVADIPVIAMTANVLPHQVVTFRAAGMDDHVGKPFKREDLYAAVTRWRDAKSR